MKPLVRGHGVGVLVRVPAVFAFVSAGVLTLIGIVMLFSGDAFIASASIPVFLFAGILLARWVPRWRRSSGSLPTLVGAVSGGGLHLKNRISDATNGSRFHSPVAVTIPRGAPVWLYEENPSILGELFVDSQPRRYWLAGEGFRFAFGSFERLQRHQFATLVAALAENDSEVHWLVERAPAEGPFLLTPVSSGSPTSLTLALPHGEALFGAYSDSGAEGWVHRDDAFANLPRITWGTHEPITAIFSVDAPPDHAWMASEQFELPGFADTAVLVSRSGGAQAMVLCPGGFSVARVFRSGGPHDLRVYVHLDGAPPPA